MSVEIRNVSVSFEEPNRALNTLRVVLKQTLDSQSAWAAGILPLQDRHKVVIVDAESKRAQYIARLVTAAGYSPLVTTSVVDAYTQFLQGSFVPIVMFFGQEDAPHGLFLLRLQQQVAQKYHWNIPLMRLLPQPESTAPVSGPMGEQPLALPQPTRRIQPTRSVQPRSRTSRTVNRQQSPLSRQDTTSPGRIGEYSPAQRAQALMPMTRQSTYTPPKTESLHPLSMPGPPTIKGTPVRTQSLPMLPAPRLPGVPETPASDIRPGRTGPLPSLRSTYLLAPPMNTPLPLTLPSMPSSPSSPLSSPSLPVLPVSSSGIAVQETPVEARFISPAKEVAKKSLEGQNLGRFQILTLLGSSPLSDVYRIYDRLRETHIALKAIQHNALPPGFLNNDYTDTNLFQQEVDTLAKLKHPHIFAVLSAGKSYISGSPFYYKTMAQSVEGSLATWRFEHGNSRPFAPQEVLPIALQVADALQCAHEQQILYQNFKLTNFLLQGEAKDDMRKLHVLLADFALIGEDNRVLCTPDTLPYLAPEQWQNKSLPASDQYGLAAILYELLTGRPPFQGHQEHLLRRMHLQMQPQAPSVFNAAVSARMDKVILRALAKNPQDRFASISEFALALREA